ncbi:MAG: DUF2785 domain-containing protein [Alphaproteobacteria bacterium]|nr:DUF2785 domain-containing protein [Alphaproteobacteria bacterium]
MRRYFVPALALLATISALSSAAQACPPAGWDRAKLEQLKSNSFEIADRAERERFAEGVIACVASPDPYLRDAVAFEALSHMLRADQLGVEVRLRIARDLLGRLHSTQAEGFEAPFAALTLAEIVRADGKHAYMSDELRRAIIDAAVAYVSALKDYRGFDEREGWRHGVAHGADLLMQIARNPNVTDRASFAKIRDAVAAKVAPAGHFYIYGEPERLMVPIVMLAQRKLFTEAEWTAWLETLANPAPLASWDEGFKSQTGLAKRHNTQAFLSAVWLNARINKNADDDVMLSGAEAALRRVP